MNSITSQGPGTAIVFQGPLATRLYQLTVVRTAVKAEAKGLKLTRGPKITPMWSKIFHCKKDELLPILDREIYGLRVRIAEEQYDCCTSDAQGIVDAQDMRADHEAAERAKARRINDADGVVSVTGQVQS